MGPQREIVTKFARDDRTEQLLAKAHVNPMPKVRLALALDSFKATGKYENAIEEWEKKPLADKTFANFRPFILKEYAKKSKPSNTTASPPGSELPTRQLPVPHTMKPSPNSAYSSMPKQLGTCPKLRKAYKRATASRSKR